MAWFCSRSATAVPPWPAAPSGSRLDSAGLAGGADVRIYDFLLGEGQPPADREAGEKIIAAYPEMPVLARENRRSLTRAVRHAAGQGIRQFLDVGAG